MLLQLETGELRQAILFTWDCLDNGWFLKKELLALNPIVAKKHPVHWSLLHSYVKIEYDVFPWEASITWKEFFYKRKLFCYNNDYEQTVAQVLSQVEHTSIHWAISIQSALKVTLAFEAKKLLTRAMDPTESLDCFVTII